MAKYFIWLPYMCVFGVKSDRLLVIWVSPKKFYSASLLSDLKQASLSRGIKI